MSAFSLPSPEPSMTMIEWAEHSFANDQRWSDILDFGYSEQVEVMSDEERVTEEHIADLKAECDYHKKQAEDCAIREAQGEPINPNSLSEAVASYVFTLKRLQFAELLLLKKSLGMSLPLVAVDADTKEPSAEEQVGEETSVDVIDNER